MVCAIDISHISLAMRRARCFDKVQILKILWIDFGIIIFIPGRGLIRVGWPPLEAFATS
jgi:hypothetical protein